MSKISIIVPVYNVEKYLDECIESIVNQTYKDLEIILIDDGSPDRCPEMCDEWAKKDSRIKVIHKKNGGGAEARNCGMDIMTGSFVSFVDSDDVIHPDFYSVLMRIILEYNCDIAECDYITDGNLPDNVNVNIVASFSKTDGMKEHLSGKFCSSLIWNKLYKKETVGNVRFISGKMIDDEFFTYKVLGNSSKTVVTDSKMYYYRQQEDSVMHRRYSLKRLAAVESQIEKLAYIKKNFSELTDVARINLAGSCIYNGQMSVKYLSDNDKKTAFKMLNDTYKSCNIKYKDLRGKRFKHKIWYMIANVSLILCCRLRNILNIGF